MSTPHNDFYKKEQRKGRAAVRNRGTVLWVSCQMVNVGTIAEPIMAKQAVQGTYNRAQHGPLGAKV
jgi:hypothetical protein